MPWSCGATGRCLPDWRWGVLLHFLRDLAEGNGSGVSLLWPLSDHAFSYPHTTYLALMAGVIATDLGLVLLRPRRRAAAW